MISDLKKICIGSANFGSYYGYKSSKIKKKEFSKIFKYLKQKKIHYIDTAINYKNSEKIIGKYNKNFKIITKIPNVPKSEKNPKKWIQKQILDSLKNLKCKKLYGVLFHHPPYEYKRINFLAIIKYLEYLRRKKIIKKIGISAYTLDQIKRSFSIYNFQIVQFQMSILDQNIYKSKLVKRLKKKNVEIHIRSIFLQGMLLSKLKNIPNKFNFLKKKIKFFENWVAKKKITRLEACLRFVIYSNFVDKVIIGTNNYSQLKETISTIQKISNKIYLPKKLKKLNSYTLNPSNW